MLYETCINEIIRNSHDDGEPDFRHKYEDRWEELEKQKAEESHKLAEEKEKNKVPEDDNDYDHGTKTEEEKQLERTDKEHDKSW